MGFFKKEKGQNDASEKNRFEDGSKYQVLNVEYFPKHVKRQEWAAKLIYDRKKMLSELASSTPERSKKIKQDIASTEIFLRILNRQRVFFDAKRKREFTNYLTKHELAQLYADDGGDNGAFEVAFDIARLKASLIIASGDIESSIENRQGLIGSFNALDKTLKIGLRTGFEDSDPILVNSLNLLEKGREQLVSILANPIGDVILNSGTRGLLFDLVCNEKEILSSKLLMDPKAAELGEPELISKLENSYLLAEKDVKVSYTQLEKLLAFIHLGTNISTEYFRKVNGNRVNRIVKLQLEFKLPIQDKEGISRIINKDFRPPKILLRDSPKGLTLLNFDMQNALFYLILNDLFDGKKVKIDGASIKPFLKFIEGIEKRIAISALEIAEFEEFKNGSEDAKHEHYLHRASSFALLSMKAGTILRSYSGFSTRSEWLFSIQTLTIMQKKLEERMHSKDDEEVNKECERILGISDRLLINIKEGKRIRFTSDEVADLGTYLTEMKMDLRRKYADLGDVEFFTTSHIIDKLFSIALLYGK